MGEIHPALLVIDMENGFINPASAHCIAGAAETVPACAQVICACRQKRIPVIFVTRKYRNDGSDVEYTRYADWISGGKAMSEGCSNAIDSGMPLEFGSTPSDYHIFKPRFSAFFQTELDILLRRLQVNTVLLTGTTTPNCIRSTCYDAISLDYNTVVIRDCVSSQTDEIQQSNLRDMENIGATIMSSVAFIYGTATIEDKVGKIQAEVLRNR